MSSSPPSPITKTTPNNNQQVLPQGPLLTKLRKRLNSATKIDLGLKEQIQHLDGKQYLKVDPVTDFLKPISLGQATTLDGSKTFQYRKSTDTWKYALQQQLQFNQYLRNTTAKTPNAFVTDDNFHQIAIESDRYAYIDPADNTAYQLHYNNGTKTYFYVNSLGDWKIFPKKEIEQTLGGELDKTLLQSYQSFSTPYYQQNPELFEKYQDQADQRVGFQIDLLSQITPNPHLQNEIIVHQPFILSPNQDNHNVQMQNAQEHSDSNQDVSLNSVSLLSLAQSSSLTASLQALSHLDGFNAMANELPLTNYHTKWYTQKSPNDIAKSNLLNTSLRGLAKIASINQNSITQQQQLLQQPLLHDVMIPKIPTNLLQTIHQSLSSLSHNAQNTSTNPSSNLSDSDFDTNEQFHEQFQYQPKHILNALLKHHDYASTVIFNTPLSQSTQNNNTHDILTARERLKKKCDIGLHLKAFLHCSCGERGPDQSLNTKQLFQTTPLQLSKVNGDILTLFYEELTRKVDPIFMSTKPLPCNHHQGIYRSQFQQFLTQVQLSNSQSKHFGIMIPRISYHAGLRQDVFYPGNVFVPFLFPLRRRSKPKKRSTNLDLYFLQSFIVFEGQDPSTGEYKTYGNISSTGSPSWWYEYTNTSTTKIPIDFVINQSRKMYCGFYTKTSSQPYILNHYHSQVLPMLYKQQNKINPKEMRI